ncbi:CRISPR-associated protein Cas4 [Thermanaerovibrio velox DSM 12556]|uniref:CRISPR-associated exonuclease Cas4 n=1 Tax=Thermanaerovibrio velox DSM 12556 TaxID=926567 RepID=H0UPW8_9BACT|nr:CRISPR-associated protein Cas4 [Thermanaerovibrio velox]EHM10677.1 CRISPR-associated protein Cas4 [Thermanaerovibrio velox DSM 12556]
MYSEEDLLPISALQHLAFCERQWGLIYLEQVWRENVLTLEGKFLHEKAHKEDGESRGDVRIVRALRLHSFRLGLVGQADVVEFPAGGLAGRPPKIVEYKSGKPKAVDCDEVQLCAQAMCLEEMTGLHIEEAEFFYGKPRRRHVVELTEALRARTERLSLRLHDLTEAAVTPSAVCGRRCELCSLRDVCLPEMSRGGRSAQRYINSLIRSSLAEDLAEGGDGL